MTTTINYCVNGCTIKNDAGELVPVMTEGNNALCDPCEGRLSRYIDTIEKHLPHVAQHIIPGSVEKNPETKATKNPVAPSPIRVAVVDLTDTRHVHIDGIPHVNVRGAVGRLQRWAELTRDMRHRTVRSRRPTMTSEIATITANWEWIITQPWSANMYQDLRGLASEIKDAVGIYRYRPVGRCPVVIQADTGPAVCGGKLVIRGKGEGVVCVTCQNTWDSDDLERLGLMLA